MSVMTRACVDVLTNDLFIVKEKCSTGGEFCPALRISIPRCLQPLNAKCFQIKQVDHIVTIRCRSDVR